MRNLIVLITAVLSCSCQGSPDPKPLPESTMTKPSIAEVIQAHDEAILAIEGVSMIYEGVDDDGNRCIKIGVVTLDETLEAKLPTELEGWRVIVEETGQIRPMFDR